MIDACFGNKKTSISQRRYLGSKTRLLDFIDDILVKEKVVFDSFADIFAGTGVVADFFCKRSNVVVNDILESNYQSYLAFFGKEALRLPMLNLKLKEYNSLDVREIPRNYFSDNFSNTYFDSSNAKIIGFIRENIEQLYTEGRINERERAYLITSLIYALDRIANTVGHYDAYRKIDLPKKILELRHLDLREEKKDVAIYKQNANDLVKNIKADVFYIDPPYNSRQYSDAYHLLENIASWEKQNVYGVAKKIDRSGLKSEYSLKSAGNAFSELIDKIEAKYILVSYNNMGTNGTPRSQSRISDYEILSSLERRGKVTVYEKSFNQFTTGASTNNDLKERIFFCRVEPVKKLKPTIVTSKQNTHLPNYVKSPLNYTGGKYKLLPQLLSLFPKNIDTFYDIFCGGANVGVNAESNRVICIDNNPHVVDLLKFVQKSNFDDLNQKILSIVNKYGLSQSYINGYDKYNSLSSGGLGNFNKKSFLALRNDYNLNKVDDKTLVLLLLIFYGFNNQIRFNSSDQFNLPVGKRDYNGNSRKNLYQFNAIANLKDITFVKGDFRDLSNINFLNNDFVYLDPPYLLGNATYNESGGWSLDYEMDLYDTLKDLNKRGIRFALSNVTKHKGATNTGILDFVKENKLNIHPISHNYRNSNYQSTARNNLTDEVLITNYK